MIVMETPSNRVNHKLGMSKAISESEEQTTPSLRAKRRWKWAIEQQILLVKLDRENQSVMSEFTLQTNIIFIFNFSSHFYMMNNYAHMYNICTCVLYSGKISNGAKLEALWTFENDKNI